MLLTYKYRIKDSTSAKTLCALATKVNYVWNYINEINRKSFSNFRQGSSCKFLTAFDINRLLSGTSKELGLHSQTIQHISESYVINRKTAKKPFLQWRSRHRSLGWVPLKAAGFTVANDTVIYQGKTYRFYKSRSLPKDAKVKTGSFNQDARGRWYLNVTFETQPNNLHKSPISKVGIDLGVKSVITLSTGQSFSNPNLTKKYESKLASFQRANKKKQIANQYAKIKNSRKDYLHKVTTQIAKQFAHIYVGNVSSQDIINLNLSANLTKGVYDASWGFVKHLFEYKAIKLGGSYTEVKESYTTQDCSSRLSRCGPKGSEELHVREWSCKSCGMKHDRDINAAKNILRIGCDTLMDHV